LRLFLSSVWVVSGDGENRLADHLSEGDGLALDVRDLLCYVRLIDIDQGAKRYSLSEGNLDNIYSPAPNQLTSGLAKHKISAMGRLFEKAGQLTLLEIIARKTL